MKRLLRLAWLLAPGVLCAQNAVTVVDAASATSTGLNTRGRGIRAVTRRTLMTVPGMEARAFFVASGVNLGTNAVVANPVPALVPPSPVAEATSPELQRPEVQAALRRLAAAGDADARRLLASPKATTAAVAPPEE